MANYKSDTPERERESSTSIGGGEDMHGRGGRSRKNALRRARARRALARRRRLDSAGVAALGSIPTMNQSNVPMNQPQQHWHPHPSQNVQLSVLGASTSAPSYTAYDVQSEGSDMNVHHERVEWREPQAGALLSLPETLYPNQSQATPPAGIWNTPSWQHLLHETSHQLQATHDHLPDNSALPPNIIPYYPLGYVQYPHGCVSYAPVHVPYPHGYVPYPHGYVPYLHGYVPYPHGYVLYPHGFMPYPLGFMPYLPGHLPYPSGHVLQYLVGLAYVQHCIPSYW